MRILLAEDDPVLADGLCRSLRRSGYALDHVKTGTEADTAVSHQAYDLMILDLGLPKLPGLEVLRRLRGRGNGRLPVLIPTALDGLEDRIKGLDLGADDYMAKPFELSELEARVRALARRALGGAPTLIQNGALSYDSNGRVAFVNGAPLELSARELGLLETLLQRAGRLVGGASWSSTCANGRRGQQQRHRGLRPPAAQEARTRRVHRHRARSGLLPGKGRRAQGADSLAHRILERFMRFSRRCT